MASRVRPNPIRRWLFHNSSWIAAGALVAGLAVLTAGPVLGSAPPQHKVEICHATPPDTAAHGWHRITVDVASVGYQHAGHQSKHDADIIPPYAYGSFTFAGKNWTSVGQAIWGNDCQAVAPTATPTATPTGQVEPTATSRATATPTGAVEAETGTPTTTLPPTDASIGSASTSGPSPLALLAILGVLVTASVVALTMSDRSDRRTR